ncbi:MAG TPA: carboxypeptidase regulatory-like domain-containing protein [Anaeromyxobacter sp.]|nr:carboxypeptidase regulatory-like domain-containing protein [Anaeromyxobacter sp.]
MHSPRRTALVGLGASFLLLLLVAAGLRWPGCTPPPPPPAARALPRPAAAPPPEASPPTRLPLRLAPGALAAAGADALPATFEGRVVSSRDGAGVAGADLTFSRGGAAASVRSDAGGAFRFQPPVPGRWLLAAVTAPGFFPFAPEWGHSPVQLEAAPGRHLRGIEVHLTPAIALLGRVVDPERSVVPGAEVRILGAADEAALVPIRDRFTTDARGEFRAAVPPGAILEARRDGFLPGRAEVDPLAIVNGRITVVLRTARGERGPGAPISGRVIAKGGAPIPGALVVATRERFGAAEGASAQAATGEDGRFELPPLDPGSYRVAARAEGRAPATLHRVAPGTRELLLELADGGRLRGCVRDAATGTPIAPFTVLVFERRSGLRIVPERTASVLDPSGCYALHDLLPGSAAVVISAPGHAPSRELPAEIPAPPDEAVADVALDPGGALVGAVLDADSGAPLAGALLTVEGALTFAPSTFPVLSEAVTGADGTFRLDGLPRRVSVDVAAAGHHARILGGLDIPPGAVAGPVEVRLHAVAPDEEPRTELAGIGAVLAAQGDGLVVVQLAAGGGAAEAGLAEGDLILRVDGQGVADLGMSGAIDAIRGPEGTVVLLQVQRAERTFDVPVPRRLVRG